MAVDEHQVREHTKKLEAAGIGMSNYKTVFKDMLTMIRVLADEVHKLKHPQKAETPPQQPGS